MLRFPSCVSTLLFDKHGLNQVPGTQGLFFPQDSKMGSDGRYLML